MRNSQTKCNNCGSENVAIHERERRVFFWRETVHVAVCYHCGSERDL